MSFFEGLSVAANLVTVGGVIFFIRQMRQARFFASASAVASIYKNVVEQIGKLPASTDEPASVMAWDREYRLELACAIILDGSSAGRTGKIAMSFVADMLTAIVRDKRHTAMHLTQPRPLLISSILRPKRASC